jgi:hypothetical protein
MGAYQILFETTEGKELPGFILANNQEDARKRVEQDLGDQNGLKRILEIKERP